MCGRGGGLPGSGLAGPTKAGAAPRKWLGIDAEARGPRLHPSAPSTAIPTRASTPHRYLELYSPVHFTVLGRPQVNIDLLDESDLDSRFG